MIAFYAAHGRVNLSGTPYESPTESGEPDSSPRWHISGVEWIVISVIVAVLVALLLPIVTQSPSSGRRTQCKNNLKQIALALHNYDDVYGTLPPACTLDEAGRPLHSWRTLILPFLEQAELYESIDLTKPWNHPDNSGAFSTTLEVYQCPSVDIPPGHTTYLALVGPDRSFGRLSSRSVSELLPVNSKSVLVLEVSARKSQHWMAPFDEDGSYLMHMSEKTDVSHVGGTQAALVDGAVCFIPVLASKEERTDYISVPDASQEPPSTQSAN